MATPESAATIPAIVGTVALDTPEAIERGLPDPEMAITSKTSIMPVTVPSKPKQGAQGHTGLDQRHVAFRIWRTPAK